MKFWQQWKEIKALNEENDGLDEENGELDKEIVELQKLLHQWSSYTTVVVIHLHTITENHPENFEECNRFFCLKYRELRDANVVQST